MLHEHSPPPHELRTDGEHDVKRSRLAIAGLLAVGVLPAATADAKTAGPLRDGNWAGTLSVGAAISFDSGATALVAQGSGTGAFHLNLAGGTGHGDYTLSGSGSSALDSADASGHANAAVTIAGEMQGTNVVPLLAATQAHADVTGAVTVNGFEVPFNESLDFGPEDIINSSLVITASSCTYASGTWAQEIKSAIQAGGANVTSFQGSWAAVYTGATPGETDAALADILARGEAILSSWFNTGTFDAEALETVLIDAEHFAAAGPKSDACGSGDPSDWSSPLAGLMERVILAMSHSTSTTAEVLRFGVAAGLRTGVLPSVNDPLEGGLHTKAQELLDLAIADGGTTDITLIQISADSMHWTDLSDQAAAALDGGQ